MTDQVARFYDDFAQDYKYIFQDWRRGVMRQGQVLRAIIEGQIGKRARKLWDCTCGIGTQAIGLAVLGYQVYGTDISPGAVERARLNAQQFQMPVYPAFDVFDLLHPLPKGSPEYDIVLSCDNSFAHFTEDASLRRAIFNMHKQCKSGGMILISIRDYDRLLKDQPVSDPPRISDQDGQRHVVFQIWDWHANGKLYDMQMFILKQSADGWQTRVRTTTLRALRRSELTQVLDEMGFEDIQWHMPENSDYYQPVVTARKP